MSFRSVENILAFQKCRIRFLNWKFKRMKSNFPAIAGLADNEKFSGTKSEKGKNENLETLEAEFLSD